MGKIRQWFRNWFDKAIERSMQRQAQQRKVKVSRGYIVIAQNNDAVNYLEQAYAPALNLKLTQTTVSNPTVCV